MFTLTSLLVLVHNVSNIYCGLVHEIVIRSVRSDQMLPVGGSWCEMMVGVGVVHMVRR